MTSPPNLSATATASDDLPEAVGPKIAMSGNVEGTDIWGSIAEALAGIAKPIKSASNNESPDKAKRAPRSEANPEPELRGTSLGAQRQIVQKNEAQLDKGAVESGDRKSTRLNSSHP